MQTIEFVNAYEDDRRADAYATLEFARTYHLAYRDLPAIFRRHVSGPTALDFGCGTGRSTRFLRDHGFKVAGVDISPQMLAKARDIDPSGDYRLLSNGNLGDLRGFDLILSAFTFDNVAEKLPLFTSLHGAMNDSGALVNVVSSPDIYVNEWASFSTKQFAGNRVARDGDIVKTITIDHADPRPVEDILFSDGAYRDVYARAGLAVEAVYKPLATGEEPYDWVSETRIAPWVIYVLRKHAHVRK